MTRFSNWSGKVTALLAVMAIGAAGAAIAADSARKKPPAETPPVAEAEDAAEGLPEATRAERALARTPGDRAAQLRAAKAQLAAGAETRSRVDAAQQHAVAVLADHPTDIEALLLAGQTSLLKGDANTAARYYRAATTNHANNAAAFLGLGDALTRLGDEAGATAAFARYRALMGMPPMPTGPAAK